MYADGIDFYVVSEQNNQPYKAGMGLKEWADYCGAPGRRFPAGSRPPPAAGICPRRAEGDPNAPHGGGLSVAGRQPGRKKCPGSGRDLGTGHRHRGFQHHLREVERRPNTSSGSRTSGRRSSRGPKRRPTVPDDAMGRWGEATRRSLTRPTARAFPTPVPSPSLKSHLSWPTACNRDPVLALRMGRPANEVRRLLLASRRRPIMLFSSWLRNRASAPRSRTPATYVPP